MEMIIESRNKQLLNQQQRTQETTTRQCNCRPKESCPLQGIFLTSSIVYKETLRAETGKEHQYIGMTEGTFKQRFYGHTSSFRNEERIDDTKQKLSEKVWSLKNQGLNYTITWDVVRRGHPYRIRQNSCDLCTSEKLEILLRSSDPAF